MRAWYHTKDGTTANLCKMLNSETTRLIVRRGGDNSTAYYPTWDAAISALKLQGEWTSDMTGKPLQIGENIDY